MRVEAFEVEFVKPLDSLQLDGSRRTERSLLPRAFHFELANRPLQRTCRATVDARRGQGRRKRMLAAAPPRRGREASMPASEPNYYAFPGLSPMRLRHHDEACPEFRTGPEFKYRIVIGGETFAEGTFRAKQAKIAAVDISTCLFSEQRRTVGAEIQVLDPRDGRLLAVKRAERRTFRDRTVTTWQHQPLPEAAPLRAAAQALPATVPEPAPA